jgi:hypothetical protein
MELSQYNLDGEENENCDFEMLADEDEDGQKLQLGRQRSLFVGKNEYRKYSEVT